MGNLSTVAVADRPGRKSATRSTGARRQRPASVGGGHSELLDASIKRISTVFSAPSHVLWAIRTPGMRRIARVELSAGWLSISLSLRLLSMPISLKIIGSMLRRNARIGGSPRIIGQHQPHKRQIVIDTPVDLVPWDSETDLDTFVDSTISSLYAAVIPPVRHREPASQAILPREQIKAAFDEAGWPSQPGESERLEVALEVPGSYLVANVDHDSSSTRLSVAFLAAELAAAPRKCRDAVTVLLWLIASRIRMVKATQSRRSLALEVSLMPGHCNAIGLAHACAALSVAIQQLAAEAALLVADEELAQIYLSKLGFSTST